jgi:hypothetical protein
MIHRRSLFALPLLALPLPAVAEGAAARPEGGWRVAFAPGEATLPLGAAVALAEIGRGLAARPAGMGRITVEGQASGPADDVSAARRLSLARAVAVRQALVAGGLEATRVDVRALGRGAAGLDVADILPPEVPRSGQTG